MMTVIGALFLIILLSLTAAFRNKISEKLYNVLISLEILFLVLITIIGLCLGFFSGGGMGMSNWRCDNLPGKYEIWQISARNIKLVLVNEDGVSAEEVIPAYVFEVGYTDSCIFAKRANVPDDYNKKIDKSNPDYYIVVIESDECFGPYDEQKFLSHVQQLGVNQPIQWLSLGAIKNNR